MDILLADDDASSRTMLAAVLTRQGYRVVEAADGAAAWEIMQHKSAPSLVILDWIMPQLAGIEVLERVRALPAEQPAYILMLTAKNQKPDIVAALDAGANDYLTKPFNLEELCARLDVGRRMLELQNSLALKITELSQALAQIQVLRGILPICASCKKIRDEQGAWIQIEEYICQHSAAEFSHGICPHCLKKLYPDYAGRL